MAPKRKEETEFKVSDKRLFTSEGELRDSTEEQVPTTVAATAGAVAATAGTSAAVSTITEEAPAPAPPASSRRSTTHTSSPRVIWMRESS